MNLFKFLYDVFVYMTNNYSSLPEEMKKNFSETDFMRARLFLSDFVRCDSGINEAFKDYE
jgi:hypothetical protein